MRKFYPLVLLALCACMPSAIKAQGQHSSTHEWIGNSISTVVNSTNEDIKNVYLYNIGTGKYLNAGSYWGTVVVGFGVGMPINITKSPTSGKYRMQGSQVTTEGNNIAFGRRKDTPGYNDSFNYNNVYVDRGVDYDLSKTPNPYTQEPHHINGILDWEFEETSSGSKTYKIRFYNDELNQGFGGVRYLKMKNAGHNNTYPLDYPSSVVSGDKSGLWKIVTKADLKAAFKEQYATDESPADATFLIYDQNFIRGDKDVEKWRASGGLTWKFSKPKAYLFEPGDADYTYYVGNGSIASNYYMAHYAGYSTANVRNLGNNTQANGKVTQEVVTLKKGWYRVSCNGFYNRQSGSQMVSKLFAKVQGATEAYSNVETNLNTFAHQFTYVYDDLKHTYDASDHENNRISPYVKGAKEFEKGLYNNTVLVYVPSDGAKLNIGVEITNSTRKGDWTCWDNFRLEYCGTQDLILDEAQTSINYITKQVQPRKAATLILKRTLQKDEWNSIVFPVSLTARQVKATFGETVKLSAYPKQSSTLSSRIDFTKVSLDNDDAVAIKANHLYLIRPTKEPTVPSTAAPYKKQIKDIGWVQVQAPYYIINNVTLDIDPQTLPNYSNGILRDASTPSTTTDERLQFCASLYNQTAKVVPANSYVLGKSAKSNNKWLWHFTQNQMAVKGFRGWIATGSSTLSKAVNFFVDGEEIGSTYNNTTGITSTPLQTEDQLFAQPSNIYSVDGKLVRPNATSTDGLPKGIYIVNHKKVIVK